MGKSPAKWVKKFLGKKPSKSYPSKKAANENATVVSVQASARESDATTVASFAPHTTSTEVKSEVEKARSIDVSNESDIPAATNQASDEVSAIGINVSNEPENLGQKETATEVQTALRSFMARECETDHSLEALIKLQAIVRGHLVRRQALATLRCVAGIVKLQVAIRGRRIKHSVTGKDTDATEPTRFSASINHRKHPSNAFASKILASSVSALPLNLQYNPDDPNSASKWLERWSSSHFWGSVVEHSKVASGANPEQQSHQSVGEKSNASSAPKREARRLNAASAETSVLQSTSEHEKPRRNNLKPSSQVESVQDHPENELERVKQSLRKISLAKKEAPEKLEPAVENSRERIQSTRHKLEASTEVLSQSARHTSNSKILQTKEGVSSGFIVDEGDPTRPQKFETETELESLVAHEPVDLPHDDQSPKPCAGENGENHEKPIENGNESQRMSDSIKQEHAENASKKTRNVPRFMAATESAKAKLRGLGSPKLAEEGEEDALVRRHSLPSSTNGKLSTMSPRIQKVVSHSNGKDRTRLDRSLTSSKDSQGKVLRPEWRR